MVRGRGKGIAPSQIPTLSINDGELFDLNVSDHDSDDETALLAEGGSSNNGIVFTALYLASTVTNYVVDMAAALAAPTMASATTISVGPAQDIAYFISYRDVDKTVKRYCIACRYV